MFDSAKYGITYTENLEEYYSIYSKHSSDEANNTKINADYKKLKFLSKGSASPKFVGLYGDCNPFTGLLPVIGPSIANENSTPILVDIDNDGYLVGDA